MNFSRGSDNDKIAQNERLARAFYTNGRFNPHFLGVAGIGFLVIYLFTRSEIFGQPAPQLVYISIFTILLALSQILLLAMARNNKGVAATMWGAVSVGLFVIFLTSFWQGFYPVSIAVALIAPIAAIRAGISRRYLLLLILLTILIFVGIWYAENYTPFDRLQSGTPASIAGIAFLVATALLVGTIITISENRNFRKLRNLLLASFIVIVTIPTIMAALLSAIGTFTNSQTQTFNTLQAISNLKENQLSVLLQGYQNDALKLQNTNGFSRHALNALTAKEDDSILKENSMRLAREQMENILGESEEYSEAMVLSTQGDVLISTTPQNEGTNYENQLFFRQGTLRPYTGFADVDTFGNENLIVSMPIFDSDGRVIRGVLVLRSDASSIKEVMENTPGFDDAETYLVDKNFRPVTKTRTPTEMISTSASLKAILNNVTGGQDIYENYENQSVLGYYGWFEPMQVAVISEIPLNTVVFNSTRALVGSAVLALFVISMAVAAVAISANSIVHPITVLAQTTESFSAGKLSARAPIERKDEIGALANSYNQMATQLQEIIGRLEQRVNDRTRDLENQTVRLQLAAEISRDVAFARNLGDLLERSARLISDRFNFFHTGIYLLDKNKEFAALVAASSEVGRQLIASHYRLRVGETGSVGRVALTGEPRITHEADKILMAQSGTDLSGTQSQMALPLKTENKVIGVLDLHSSLPQAFREDDIAIMQTLADQLATAIERTRLLQEVENSLKELESAYGRYTREGWDQIIGNTQTEIKGYRFDNIRIEPVDELHAIEKNVLETGLTTSSQNQLSEDQKTVALPVKLRGQTIGVISVKLKQDHEEDIIATIELASERLAAALESARLYEEARLRADREQSISQVATAISAATTYEDILQTTVREIGVALKESEVSIQITGEPYQQNG